MWYAVIEGQQRGKGGEREGVDLPDAVHQARAVISVLGEAVSPGEMADARAQLPDEYDPLFGLGSEGEMDTPS